MLDSNYHMTLKIINNQIFWRKNVVFLPSFLRRYNGRHNAIMKSINQ